MPSRIEGPPVHVGGDQMIADRILSPYFEARVFFGPKEASYEYLKEGLLLERDATLEDPLGIRQTAIDIIYETCFLAVGYNIGRIKDTHDSSSIDIDQLDDRVLDQLKYCEDEGYFFRSGLDETSLEHLFILPGTRFVFPGVESIVMVQEGVVINPKIITAMEKNNKYRTIARGLRDQAENRLIVRVFDPDNLELKTEQSFLSEEDIEVNQVLQSINKGQFKELMDERDKDVPPKVVREIYTTVPDEDPSIERTMVGYYLMYMDLSGSHRIKFVREVQHRPHVHYYKKVSGTEQVLHTKVSYREDENHIRDIEALGYQYQSPQEPLPDLEVTNVQLAALLVLIKNGLIRD